MTEGHAIADRQQSCPSRPQPPPRPRCRAARPHATPAGGRRPARRRRPAATRWASVGKRLEPPQEALLDPPRQRLRAEQAEPAGQLRRAQPSRQLEQRQRIAPRLGHDPITHAAHRADCRRPSPSSARASPSRSPWTSSSGSPRSSSPGSRAANTSPTDSASSRRADEPERPRGGPIQPLRVVDHAQQRALLRHLREQAQHRQPDQEPDPAAVPR